MKDICKLLLDNCLDSLETSRFDKSTATGVSLVSDTIASLTISSMALSTSGCRAIQRPLLISSASFSADESFFTIWLYSPSSDSYSVVHVECTGETFPKLALMNSLYKKIRQALNSVLKLWCVYNCLPYLGQRPICCGRSVWFLKRDQEVTLAMSNVRGVVTSGAAYRHKHQSYRRGAKTYSNVDHDTLQTVSGVPKSRSMGEMAEGQALQICKNEAG